jgi:hypothetical protein
VLNLETNQIMETCVVIFDGTCVGDDELGEEIFEEEEC